MIIPLGTDAPLYHVPWVTFVLIIICVACFFGIPSPEPYSLEFGDGLHPAQWLSHVFMHGDVMHLVGNMIFLWTFGLVVEGKIGWWRYVLIFLVVGCLVGLVTQVLMIFAPQNHALGASAAIFGLVAIAAVWAPRNELNCVLIVYYRAITFEISILIAAFCYMAWDFICAAMSGFTMSGALAHLMGGSAGLAIGFGFLLMEWVDCEGYDLLTIWKGREGQRLQTKRELAEKEEERERTVRLRRDRVVAGRQQVTTFVDSGQLDAALRLFNKLKVEDAALQWSEKELLLIIQQLLRDSSWEQVVPLMREYIQRFSRHGNQVRLQLARVMLIHQERPLKALRILDELPDSLSPSEERLRQQLVKRAERMRQDGVIELSDD